MKVLVDARGLLEEVRAGVESYTYNMLENLQRMYPEDEYILFSYSRTRKPPVELLKRWQWHHFNWSNIFLSLSFRYLDYPKVDRRIGRFDWVWFPNIRFFPVTNSLKKIVTVHDLSYEIIPDCYSIKRRLWHWHMNIKQNLSQANKIICVSKNTQQDLQNWYNLPPEKIRTIYPGLPEKIDMVKAKSTPKKYLVCVGTLEERKNILGLLKAYEYYAFSLTSDPLPLILIGGLSLTWDIAKYLQERKLDKLVKVCGFLSDEEKEKYFLAAAMLIYPSYYEGFGFPPLEGVQRNIPVLASFGGSLGEIVGNRCLLFDPLDWRAMGINIQQILEEKSGWQSNLNNNLSVFSWKKAAQSFREILMA